MKVSRDTKVSRASKAGERSRAPRREPTQERSRATVDAILDATGLVARERGVEHVRLKEVATRAGVSQGTLYDYFPNVEALVAAWEARRFEVAGAEAAALVFGFVANNTPLRQCVRELVEFALGKMEEDFYQYYRYPSETGFVSRQVKRTAMAERLAAVVAGTMKNALDRHLFRSPHYERSARMATNMVISLAHDCLTLNLTEEARADYRCAIVEAVGHYLLIDEPPVPSDSAEKTTNDPAADPTSR